MTSTKATPAPPAHPAAPQIPKTPTGIEGLDAITDGGLPTGRATLVCGGPGCGKTLLAMEFLARGALQFNEPGVFLSFEETARELTLNIASLGVDLNDLTRRKLLVLDHVRTDRHNPEASGDFSLDGLFIRLGHAIEAIGARRVVLDSVESVFDGLPNRLILRAELRRLFGWLKDKGVTSVITGDGSDRALTRHGLEEYVSDCVIELAQHTVGQASSRRMRVIKYRGSTHGSGIYPFVIDPSGIVVLPITSKGLAHAVCDDRVSSGIADLDTMLGGAGYYRGSSVLVTGSAGTGKTSLAAQFCDRACARGERALYFAFEESSSQIIRNMRSIGIDLAQWVDKGLLRFQATRPSFAGLETQLMLMYTAVKSFGPQVVVVDPLNGFLIGDNVDEVKFMLMRLADMFNTSLITGLFTSSGIGDHANGSHEASISSLIDTWLILEHLEMSGERNRTLSILKARGMPHSNQIREYVLGSSGVHLSDVYIGPRGVLTGSARMTQQAQEQADALLTQNETERLRLAIASKQHALEAKIELLRDELSLQEEQARRIIGLEESKARQLQQDRAAMGIYRTRVAPAAPGAKHEAGPEQP